MAELTFGFQAAPSDERPQPDARAYEDVIEDCRLGQALGYEAAWMLEHHFSDYYPTPSPLLLLAHVARELPDLGLGTAVLVLPWYHPMRLAEELAMLASLTRGTLRLGIGRGSAKSEYDAYDVDMNQARARFAETLAFVQTALKGEPFTFDGAFFKVPRPVRLRPAPAQGRIEFYGAIGSVGSGGIMADLGVPPFCLSTFPAHVLARILETWKSRTAARGGRTDVTLPVSIKLLVADSDAQAFALGRRYLPAYFDLQCRHYEVDANPWAHIEGYQDFSRMFANLKTFTDPAKLDPYMRMNLIGSPETIAGRLEELATLGFSYVMVGSSTPGMPKALQRESLARFAREVAPRFSAAFAGRERAA